MSVVRVRTISGPFVARSKVVHVVKVEHEPFTIYEDGVQTVAITTTACGVYLQGIPLSRLHIEDGDRLCKRCDTSNRGTQ